MAEGSLQPAIPSGTPSLADVASQLNSPQENPASAKPQVVFVGATKSRRTVEVSVTPRQRSNLDSLKPTGEKEAGASTHVPNVGGVTNGVEAIGLTQSDAPNADPYTDSYAAPYAQMSDSVGRTGDANEQAKFAFDPFALEFDGPVPAMPTLPIVDAIEMTQKVVSREKAGAHYAWRLMPGPYPDVGNSPDVKGTETAEVVETAEVAEAWPTGEVGTESGQSGQSGSECDLESAQKEEPRNELAVEWSEMEVVSSESHESLGDSFVVQPGEVIYIDGNQGYDHIDLRSYRVEDATFQPGAILLDSDPESVENEETPAPITIRHRGVAFAIFNDEIRVEL